MKSLSVRCSSLPLIASCAPAAQERVTTIEGDRGPSDLGTAFHACMERFVSAGTPPATSIAEQASRYNVDADDLAPMVWWATKAWTETLSSHFPQPQVELALDAEDPELGILLTGHTDVLSYLPAEREVRILDYKSGWIDADARHQLRGYGMLGMLKYPAATHARVSKLQVREGRIDTELLSREELESWWGWFTDHLRDNRIYRPGEHCERCPHRFGCKQRTAALRHSAEWLPTLNTEALATMDAEQMASVLIAARAMEKVLGKIIGTIKQEVALRGPEGFGRLHLKEEKRETINVGRGYGVLSNAIGVEDLIPLFKVSKKDVTENVMAKAPRGRKGPAVKELMEQLGGAGALEVSTIHKLEVRSNGTGSTDTERASIGIDSGEAAGG